MNEEKVLQLLLDLVGGEKSFEWLGEKAGRSVNRTFDRSDKMIQAVVGGLAPQTLCLALYPPTGTLTLSMRRRLRKRR